MTLARRKGPHLNHAMLRGAQRYGLTLTIEDLKAMTKAIQRNKGTLLARLENGKSAWLLPWKGQHIKLVMSPDLWKVVTLLPPHADLSTPKPVKAKRPRRKREYWRNGKRYFAREAA